MAEVAGWQLLPNKLHATNQFLPVAVHETNCGSESFNYRDSSGKFEYFYIKVANNICTHGHFLIKIFNFN